jgi:hypothetical protein
MNTNNEIPNVMRTSNLTSFMLTDCNANIEYLLKQDESGKAEFAYAKNAVISLTCVFITGNRNIL